MNDELVKFCKGRLDYNDLEFYNQDYHFEILALLRNIYSDEYIPVQILWYFILEERDGIICLVRQNKMVDVHDISFTKLLGIYEEMSNNIPNFLGFLSKDCGIEHYYNLIKENFNNKEIKIDWPKIKMADGTIIDFENGK